MSEELKDLIVEGFVRHRSRNDIIQAACERGGLEWEDSERLVQQVEIERAHAIARGQSPLLLLLSAATVAAGVLIANYSLEFVRDIFEGDLVTKLVLLGSSFYPLGLTLTGLAMIAGGLIGMWKTLLRYFETSP